MIAFLVGVPVVAAIAYAVWLSRGLRTLARAERSIDHAVDRDDDEPAPALDFWDHRRAR